MNAKTEIESSSMDTPKLVLAVVLLAGGIGAFYYFEEYSLLFRVLGLLAVASVAVVVIMQTMIGRKVWAFAADSRNEVRKVVWPTRQETIQMTLVVFAMVLVMGIILWLFDLVLMNIVRAVTG